MFQIKIANIKNKNMEDNIKIDIKDLLKIISESKRSRNFLAGIENVMHNLKDSEHVQKDELKFMEEQMYNTPFFLVKKWSSEGVKKRIFYERMRNSKNLIVI